MSNRSLSASPQGQKLLRKALERQNLTQMALVNERGIASWSTINRFFNGKPVKRELFIEICDELDLNWQDVATFPQAESPQLTALDKLWLQLIEIGSSTDNMGLVLAKEETLAWGIKLPSRYEKLVPIGSHIQFEINLEIQGYLLLLLKDTTGKINCFCPSCFAPNSQITAGKTTLPQEGSPLTSFHMEGEPGEEQIMAIITKQALNFEWLPQGNDDPLQLEENHFIQILNYVNSNSECEILYTSYQIIR
jgi:hypothetical protein